MLPMSRPADSAGVPASLQAPVAARRTWIPPETNHHSRVPGSARGKIVLTHGACSGSIAAATQRSVVPNRIGSMMVPWRTRDAQAAGAPATSTAAHVAQEIALAELYTGVTQDVVSRRAVEVDIRQHERLQIVP